MTNYNETLEDDLDLLVENNLNSNNSNIDEESKQKIIQEEGLLFNELIGKINTKLIDKYNTELNGLKRLYNTTKDSNNREDLYKKMDKIETKINNLEDGGIDKSNIEKYVNTLITQNNFNNWTNYYKLLKNNTRYNIKLLGYVLNNKQLYDIKDKYFSQLSESTMIQVKKGAELDVLNLLFNNEQIKKFISENKKYNIEKIIGKLGDIEQLVPKTIMKLFNLIKENKISNSFYGKTEEEINKHLAKYNADFTYKDLEKELPDYFLSNNYSTDINLYASIFKVLKKIQKELNIRHSFIDYILENKVLNDNDKKLFSYLENLLSGILKKLEKLVDPDFKFQHIQLNIRLFSPESEGRAKTYKDSPQYYTILTSLEENITKSYTTRIWNIFKSVIEPLYEIPELYNRKEVKNHLEEVSNYIFMGKDILQNLLDLTDYKITIKQMLLSGYFYMGQKIVEGEDLIEIVKNVLIKDYNTSNEYKNLSISIKFPETEKYSFVKDFDDNNTNKLIEDTEIIFKKYDIFKQTDYNVLSYIKGFMFKYILENNANDLLDNSGAKDLLSEKYNKIVPKWMLAKITENYNNLVTTVKSVSDNIINGKISKKYIYNFEFVNGTNLQLVITLKKDIQLEYNSKLTYDDLVLARENIIYYIVRNFPELKEKIKDSNILINRFTISKLIDKPIYTKEFNNEKMLYVPIKDQENLIYSYGLLGNHIADWSEKNGENNENYGINYLEQNLSVKDKIKLISKIFNSLNFYIFNMLVSNNLVYVYKKRVI